MKFITATDVESAGRRLVLGKGDRLTPLAHDRAKELSVEMVTEEAQREATPSVRAPAVSSLPAAVAATSAVQCTMQPEADPSKVSASGAIAYRHPSRFVPSPSGAMYRRNALGPGVIDRVSKREDRPKAAVVGAGHVGAMTALRLAESDLFSKVTLVDVVPGLAAGLALDMWHGAGLYHFSTRLAGSEDFATLADAEYVVVTAGKPRQPGMSRTDLTGVNGTIIESVSTAIRTYAPRSTVVVVTNPLEEMTHLSAVYTGFPEDRVLGMAGVLDSARFCSLVALTGRAKPEEVRAVALGSHGPEMVIPLSQAFIRDQLIESVLDSASLKAIVERTRDSGGEVVKLLQQGSAYFTPAESAAAMVRAMAYDSGEVLSACVRSRGAYGTSDTRIGLPVRLGRCGVKEIVHLRLRPEELSSLHEAALRIAARIQEIGKRP